MKVSVIGGAGYVGLITGLGIATMGHEVVATDIDEERISLLNTGKSPIFEEYLDSLLKHCIQQKGISFSKDVPTAIKNSDLVIVSVGTPSTTSGQIDLSQVKSVLKDLSENLTPYTLIVIKSTLPITAVNMLKIELSKVFKEGKDFEVASNPEFLREGRAIYDFYNPDRIVIGSGSEKAIDILKNFYEPLVKRNLSIPNEVEVEVEEKTIPFVVTNLPSAQMIKYGSNAFLANKISFVNEIAQVCESVGADVKEVINGMGMDPRIGSNYMQPGPGFGGPCLEKDLSALVELGRHFNLEATFMKSILDRNERQIDLIKNKLDEALGGDSKKVSIFGLSFKAGTNDTRNSASIKLIEKLLEDNFYINCYDPVADVGITDERVIQFEDPYDCVKSTGCLAIMTEWPEFKDLDWARISELMGAKIILDMRNLLDSETAKSKGFNYMGLGS
ncbi:MAG: UDP-glucose 6-dehydrogenase [Actinobacteria bacterium]|nr:UDP-glucose 6-dehydrogenase [Actinomycetota bacterium]|tara:strand:+ start:201 stop:1538 length:1338 start_codon:yes stop_codon:yes gene_type:complete